MKKNDFNNSKIISNKKITKIDKDIRTHTDDYVVSEYSLSIFINDIYISTLICSNCNLKELALGHIFTNRLIENYDDINRIVLEENENKADIKLYIDNEKYIKNTHKKIITSSSGVQYNSYQEFLKDIDKLTIEKNIFKSLEIIRLANEFSDQSEAFKMTGGLHSCKLHGFSGEDFYSEDIGRHNAFDKAIGMALLERFDLNKSLIITSGRVPSDMVIKAVSCKIPILVSRSAPTDVSIDIAKYSGLTLIGFARGEKFNIYSHPERII